jgi:hypothetical protein
LLGARELATTKTVTQAATTRGTVLVPAVQRLVEREVPDDAHDQEEREECDQDHDVHPTALPVLPVRHLDLMASPRQR